MIPTQCITRPIIHVAFPKHISLEFLLCRFGILPVRKVLITLTRHEYLPTVLIFLALGESRDWIAPDLARLMVDFDRNEDIVEFATLQGAMMTDMTDMERTSTDIQQREHALGTVEELVDHGNVEAFGELLPHVGSHSVAIHGFEVVCPVERRGGSCQQIAHRFAHIYKGTGRRVVNVLPEIADAELAANGQSQSRDHTADGRRATRA